MEKDNKNLPSWLQDRKKALIIGIVLAAAILSFVSKLLIGSLILDSALVSRTKDLLGDQTISVINILKSKQKLYGTYSNDYADEELHFHLDGSMEYTAGESFGTGNYELNDKKLTMTINGEPAEFDIIEKSDNILIITNGMNIFSFTKVE